MTTKPTFQRLLSVEIEDGYLGGLQVDLASHLNCVIGSKGAGKTTLLEFIRYALQIGGSDSKALTSLVSSNLKSGAVRLILETKEGVRYRVERRANGAPRVFNDAGELVPAPPEGLLGTGVYVFSQAEIEGMANSPEDRLALIDRFAEEELRQINQELTRLTHKLGISSKRLLETADEVEDLDSLRFELGQAQEARRALRAQTEDQGHDFDRATALKTLREQESRGLSGLIDKLADRQVGLEQLPSDLTAGLASTISEAAKTGPNGKVFEEVGTLLEGYRATVQEAAATILAAAKEAQEGLERVSGELQKKHAKQDQTYEALLKKHENAREVAQKILEYDRTIADVENTIQDQVSRHEGFELQREERRSLLRQLSDLRDRRNQTRKGVVEGINRELKAAKIEVVLEAGGDTAAYEKAIAVPFRGVQRTGRKRILQSLTSSAMPTELAEWVRKGDVAEIRRVAGITESEAKWAIEHLSKREALHELEAFDIPDLVRIRFFNDAEWKDTSELSTGQKFTAILPILLHEGDKPLVCDEPESHLDQETLVEKVVAPLQALKGKRQVIFATHNANLVVLGDAGDTHVVVLDSDGKHSRIHPSSGTVDDAKGQIEALLEGGAKAFERRANRYGKTMRPL